MKNLKTFEQFISESTATAALNQKSTDVRNQKDINQDRKLTDPQKDKKFIDKTKKQADVRVDEIDKRLNDVGQQQNDTNNRMEDIKLKQDLLPDDPNARKQFIADTQSDLKGVESELNNTQQQRIALQKQKERIQKNFQKK